MIGEGRIGLIYSAQINAGTDTSGQDILTGWLAELPPTLCVKVKPQYCRTLAREAWFYEQLHEVQGIATARCYAIALAECGRREGCVLPRFGFGCKVVFRNATGVAHPKFMPMARFSLSGQCSRGPFHAVRVLRHE